MRSAVVLPEPDGPTSSMNSPSWTSRSSASTAGASVPGYILVAWTYRTSANGRHSFQLGERRPELAAQPRLGVGPGFELVEPEQRGAHDCRGCGRTDGDVRRGLA